MQFSLAKCQFKLRNTGKLIPFVFEGGKNVAYNAKQNGQLSILVKTTTAGKFGEWKIRF